MHIKDKEKSLKSSHSIEKQKGGKTNSRDLNRKIGNEDN